MSGVNLGSAYGEIVIKADKATQGAQETIRAIRQMEAQAAGSGRGFDRLGRSGEQMGRSISQGAKEAERGIQMIARSAEEAGGAFDTIGDRAGVLGSILTASLGVAAKSASDLQTELAAISTIKPDVNLERVGDEIAAISGRVAKSQTELAESLYGIFGSVEVSQAEALRLTEQFAKGAIAARTDAETFGNAILGVTSAYNLQLSESTHVSDVFFQTVADGVISGEQLATGLGNLSQSANAAGVSFDTLGALIAASTKAGGSAETNLNNLQNVLAKITTADVQEGLEALGVATKNADGSFRDIVGVLRDLDGVLSKLNQSQRTEVIQKLFPDQQARIGLQTLLGQLDYIEQAAVRNAKAAGVTAEAYQKMGQTAAAQGQLLKNALQGTLIDLGEIALPGLVDAAEQIRGIVGAFNDLPSGVKSATVTSAELMAIFLLLGAAGIKVATTVIQIATAARTATTAMLAFHAANRGLIATLGGVGVALVGFDIAIRAATDNKTNLIDLAVSLVKYGDAFGFARDEARKFFQEIEGRNEGDRLKALAGRREELEAQIAATERHLTDLEDRPFSIGQIFERFNLGADAPFKVVGQLEALKKELAELEALELRYQRAKQGFKTNEQGTILPFAGMDQIVPFANQLEGLTDGFGRVATAAQLATQATAGLTPTTQQAMAIVAALGGAAGQAAREVDTLSESFFANQEAAQAQASAIQIATSQAERFGAMRDHLTGLQAAAQGVTSSVQPMQAAFDLLNGKIAAGIPLTAEQAHLYDILPGKIAAATSGYDKLITDAGYAAVALQNIPPATVAAGGAFSTTAGQASHLQGVLDELAASSIKLEGAIGALGQENAELAGYYNVLNERVQVLNDKKKEGGTLTADETAELARLQSALDKIGGTMGGNTAKQREFILSLLEGKQATADYTGQLNTIQDALGKSGSSFTTASDGLVGLTDGLGNVATAAGGAFTPVQGISQALADLPSNKTVRVDFQIGEAGKAAAAGLEKLTGTYGGSQAIKVTADTSAAETALDTIQKKLSTLNTTVTDPDITATDNASPVAATATTNINAVPDGHDTLLTVTDQATQKVLDLIGLINSVPATLSVTASVDTSGAMAAIRELRANMPSSPAEKGPFRTLPNWQSVFESLAPAGEDAVRTIEGATREMARAIGDGIDAATDESASKAADLATKVAGAVNASADALERIGTARLPKAGQFERFRAAMLPILDAFAADGAGSTEEGLKSSNLWAEHAQKIFQALSSGADALAKLRDYTRPADRAIEDFRDASQYLVKLLVQVAQDSDQGLTEAGAKWAEAAQTIFGAIGSGVDALTKLHDFRRPTDRAVEDFRDVSQYLVNLIAQVAADIEDEALPKAHDWADTAHAIFGALSSGVDGLTKLHEFTRPTDRAVEDFRDVSQYVVNLLAQVAADIEDQALPKAKEWAETADAIFGALSSGVDGLTKLHEFVRPTDAALRAFRDVAQFAVNLIAEVAAVTDAEMTEAAATYAEAANTVLSFIGNGAAALGKIGSEDEFTPPSRATLDKIAESARQAVLAIAEAARLVDVELTEEAATWADGTGKSVALIGAGFDNFKDIGGFIPPSDAQIRALVNVAAETVRRIAEAAKAMDQEAVKAAGEWGENGGRAIGVIGDTLSAFSGMKDFVAPSKEGIDEVVAVAAYTAHRLADVSAGFDPKVITRIGEFGSGVSDGLSGIRAALDLGKSFQDEDRVKPADALGTALQEFQAGIAPLNALHALSETYLAKGTQIGANFAQAWQAIRSGYPGYDPAAALAGAGAAIPVNQTIIHRFEGAIEFRMMDENGEWVVRSLRADQASRRDMVSMVVEEVLSANPAV